LHACEPIPHSRYPGAEYEVKHREGIIAGNKGKLRPQLRNRRILKSKGFPGESRLYFNGGALPKVGEIRTHSRDSTNLEAFAWPQLVIKQSWQKEAARFQARLTHSARHEGVLCTQSYITVHVPYSQSELLEAGCLSLNSKLATYYLMLTSGRFATYRPEPLVAEILSVPIPRPGPGLLDGVSSLANIDARVFEAFAIKDAERVLIEDLFDYALPDFRGDHGSPGRRPTAREESHANEPQLSAYCEYFVRVLKAGFGSDKTIKATVFQEEEKKALLPYRLVAFELGGIPGIGIARMTVPQLLSEFDKLDRRRIQGSRSGIYQQRVARVYETLNGIPTIFVIKPDMHRYWTRSAGLSDADQVALDLFNWRQVTASSEVA
jgi:hypothetical protein